MNRQEALTLQRRQAFDILVIGGGATGTGVALDAASRGLSVALVERGDFSCGTSSRSTKLVHGGVRYLEQAILRFDRSQFRLVRDALHERATLFRIAPHLVTLLPIFTPVYRSIDVPYYLTGLKLYDRLAGTHNLRPSHFIRPKNALRKFPLLNAEGLRGGVIYYDGQFDDARMNVTLALTASEQGAAVANYVSVAALLKEKSRVVGARLRDEISGEEWETRAKVVVNATGPFVDTIRKMESPGAAPILSQSSGVHIVLDPAFVPPDMGLLVPKTDDGRVLFVLPWGGRALVGTTDNPAPLEENPKPKEEEITYLLEQLSHYYRRVPKPKDILAQWSGLRPLVSDIKASDTARLSRDHVVHEGPGGLVTVAGGKWTTYRRMAVDAVNHAVTLGKLSPRGPSRTEDLLLAGAEGFTESGKDKGVRLHLTRSYGSRSAEVEALVAKGYGKRLSPKFPYLEAEVVYGALVEAAQTASDILARRTRLAFLDQKAALAALPRVIELLGEVLGWDKERRQREFRSAKDYLSPATKREPAARQKSLGIGSSIR